MCIIASISVNECFSAVEWLQLVIFKAFHRFFFLSFNLWGLAAPVKDSYIPHPRAFQFLTWLSFEICCSVKHYCRNLRSLAPRISFSICLYLVPSFFFLYPYKTFSPCCKNWQPQREAVSTALSCRRRAVHSTRSPVCYSWWPYVSFSWVTCERLLIGHIFFVAWKIRVLVATFNL